MQKVKKCEIPRDLSLFFDSIQMEIKRMGFCVTDVLLALSYLESNELPETISSIREQADKRSLSAVRVENTIIFRKAMRPMEDVTEIQRASGDAICEICQFAFKHHPQDTSPNDFLNVLCNGRRVKL